MLEQLKYRIRQFRMAKSFVLSDADVVFAQNILSKQEQILFFGMSPYDQGHSLAICYEFLKEADQYSWVNQEIFFRGVLLHDCGKATLIISPEIRSFFVFVKKVFPKEFMDKLAIETSRSYIRRGFYVLENHPEIGARRLEMIGSADRVVEMARLHQTPPSPEESEMLPLLRDYDRRF